MITATGYSKDVSIQPEGIVITFAKVMYDNHGGIRKFLKEFSFFMNNEEYIWLHWCRLQPKIEFDHVYIVIANRLYGRCFFGGFRAANGDFPSALILAGPFEKCPFKRELKGFRGFRYCTKLF